MPVIRTDEVQMVSSNSSNTREWIERADPSCRLADRNSGRSTESASSTVSVRNGPSTASECNGRSEYWCCRSVCGMRSCLCCSPACSLVSLPAAFVIFLIVFGIGSAVERSHVVSAEPTGWVYETPEVCSVSNRTYADVGAALGGGEDVRHCGACGQCSDAHDIQIYFDTLETLTDTSTTCAVKAVLQGEQAVTNCFDHRVNLTRGCTTCWVENVMCDLRHCVFTCLLYRMGFGGAKNSGDGKSLSHCLECDEKRCGPAFIRCAGANRRRAGIYSDIERNCSHVCKVIDEGPGADPSEAQQACENE